MMSISDLLNPVTMEAQQSSTSRMLPLPPRSRELLDRRFSLEEAAEAALPERSPQTTHHVPVNFPPFESKRPTDLRSAARFRIQDFGKIHNSYEHIPYSSSKKDFTTKTGKDCIEAFTYTFMLPGQDAVHTVLWDFNIGLVRMSPIFKCLGFSKTKPSQIMKRNPGLLDISPHVTGGAVAAQGYWMPFECARALCTTCCFPIAGALVPVFGFSFPTDCVPTTSPAFGRIIIDPDVIARATERTSTAFLRGFPEPAPVQQRRTASLRQPPSLVRRRATLAEPTHVKIETTAGKRKTENSDHDRYPDEVGGDRKYARSSATGFADSNSHAPSSLNTTRPMKFISYRRQDDDDAMTDGTSPGSNSKRYKMVASPSSPSVGSSTSFLRSSQPRARLSRADNPMHRVTSRDNMAGRRDEESAAAIALMEMGTGTGRRDGSDRGRRFSQHASSNGFTSAYRRL